MKRTRRRGAFVPVTSFESCRVCHGDLAEDLVESPRIS